MTTGTQPEYVSGFGIPFPLGVLRAAMDVGEAGAAAGTPDKQARSDGSLPTVQVTAYGPQTPGTTVKTRYVTPGYPPAAGYAVKEAADDDWQGRDTPLLGVRADVLAATVGAGAVEEDQSHGVVLPNGTRVVARRHNALTGARIYVQSKAPGASSWSDTALGSTGHAVDADLWPCLLVLGSAVLLFHWTTDTTASSAQVDAWQSLDGGVTWVRYQRSILPATVSTVTYDLGRLRAGMLSGQIFLSAHVIDTNALHDPRDFVMQWASADRAGSLTLIGTHSSDSSGLGTGVGFQDVAAYDGRLFVSVADRHTQFIQVWILGNAWTPLSSLPFDGTTYGSAAGFGHLDTAMMTMAANAIADADQAMAVLEGALYLIARVPNDQTVQVARWAGAVASRSFAYLGSGPTGTGHGALWRQDGTPSDYPSRFCAWGWRGRLQLACNWVTDAGTYDDQLWLLDAGGNATKVSPFNRRFHGDQYQAGWDWTWAATSLPTAGGATMTSVGTGTASITTTPGRMRLTTTANTRYFTWTETGSPAEARMGLYLHQVSGGAVIGRTLACGIRYGTTGHGWDAEIRFSGSQARLYDLGGAVAIATVNVDVSAGVYILLAVSASGNVLAGVAEAGEGHERVFKMLANGVALTDDLGAGGTDVVYMMGNRATGTVVSEWSWLGIGHDASFAASTTLADGQSNPDDLTPIPAGRGEPSYLGHGVSAIMRGGPAWVGDEVWIPSAAAYAARNLLPRGWEGDDKQDRGGLRPSPAAGWRSSSPASPWRLPFQHPSRLEEQVPRGYLYLHIEKANFPACILTGRQGGTWHTLGLWVGAVTMTFTRTGARLILSGAAATYLRTNDLIGGYAHLDSGAGVKKCRPILRNTGGPCGDGTTGPIVVVDMDPATLDGTEPTSGSVDLYFPRATLIVPLASSAKYDAYAVEFAGAPTAPYTYEGDYRAGVVAIGEIWTVNKADWGTQRARESNTDLTDLDNGRRIARVRAARRRVYELPYTSIRTEGFLQDEDVPSWYYLETGGAVVGMDGAEAETMEGVLEELEGAAKMFVYLPVIEADGGNTMLRGSQAGLYGRLTTAAVTWTIESGDQRAAHVAGMRLRIEEEL